MKQGYDRKEAETPAGVMHVRFPFKKMDYDDFLKTKIEIAKDSGFEISPHDINKALKPHQRDAVCWALHGGRRALFESFGLGKTIQEIEFCYQAVKHAGGKALIVLPLGVKQEFTRDAVEVLGYRKPEYIRNMEEAGKAEGQILLTNYERVRDGDIRPDAFTATSLDEASVLRSFGSKTYQTFLDKFKDVPYKLVATATPSPNRYKELIHYAGYLEVMDTGQALTRFFQRDSTKANNLTLYPNMEEEFWMWVSSWALFITKPSDLSKEYSDEGYDLPPLEIRWHELPNGEKSVTDKNGTKIFESDICRREILGGTIIIGQVVWVEYGMCGFKLKHGNSYYPIGKFEHTGRNGDEVIGNIFDNPELLKSEVSE